MRAPGRQGGGLHLALWERNYHHNSKIAILVPFIFLCALVFVGYL